ncbi:CcmD family protein [Hymenobacter volaticus]|uniref:CcmD family protein n=1 Tax=Hymenobacter volaticus TaxID=2932254 RepID=A0ABY4G7F9_9BACT|nr:CcmD family protein [Hymenobacter volaticus]UOQ66837.1 CcmD family protein [Hymenobacter volaticus]
MKNSLLNGALGIISSPRRLALLLLTWLLPVLQVAAQTASDTPEMADALRGSGKIYVVVAVVTVVLAGLLALLVSLDRKVSRLERELKE